jgi:hypothetical protein
VSLWYRWLLLLLLLLLIQCCWTTLQSMPPSASCLRTPLAAYSLEGSRLGTSEALARACREKHTVRVPLLLLLCRLTAPRAWAQPGAGLMPPACWAVNR